MISFQNVVFRYESGRAPALDGVTLDVRDGEILALVGANGSGKSTLGRLANALLAPSTGAVSVDGVSTDSAEGRMHARRTVGMVFQNPDSGIVSASVEEDIAFTLENRALPRAQIAAAVDRTLTRLGLADDRTVHPMDLTVSNRARLGLAAAVVGDPRYLIMDEATAYLDATDRAALMEAVAEVRQATGMAVVLITHLMDETLEADRVVVLSGGHVVFTGTPRELFARAEDAHEWRLELPPLLDLQRRLGDHGLDIGPEPLTRSDALERLCRLS